MIEWILLVGIIVVFISINNAIADLKHELQNRLFALSKDVETINERLSYLIKNQEKLMNK